MSMMRLLAAFGLAGCSSMGMGMSTPMAVKVTNGSLTDAHGMTLYTFDRDAAAGKSACNGKCADNWPPLAANDADKPSGDYTIITRDDGKKQWAFDGYPLYTSSLDHGAGDVNGSPHASGDSGARSSSRSRTRWRPSR